ncbi:threonylcarbamoyl-AMP synthase [Candidatus Gottesmanbacteria bacterium RBG_16_43_7]|uniref:L-threonylcarbamoyladenylate synthase n=1 Tax=Candidatus Gottesmanbacteria bacterium RBG_16_43_7 TaxID=1798373 RepID=A0A1F5Z7C0_9BACT|nr:MAG: threonylcarbamoyl-AMP synthase [Candidatus Gottesmanbacteria bacterium RBG_16_43_7]
MNSKQKQALKILAEGGIVILPTDTAFAISCRIDNSVAVDKLFKIRRRPRIMATPLLVSSLKMALSYYRNPSRLTRLLMEQYWPGAVTIVEECKTAMIYEPLRGGLDTIGLRMPDHGITLEIIRQLEVGIVGTSANYHGTATSFKLTDLDQTLIRQVDYILEGKCKIRAVSTVVDTRGLIPRIIRQGAVVLNQPLKRQKSIILYINTATTRRNMVALDTMPQAEAGQVMSGLSPASLLSAIIGLLHKNKLVFSDISGIVVNRGPGSFTGLRVGIAVARTFGLLLGIRVNGQQATAQITPIYEKSRFDSRPY